MKCVYDKLMETAFRMSDEEAKEMISSSEQVSSTPRYHYVNKKVWKACGRKYKG